MADTLFYFSNINLTKSAYLFQISFFSPNLIISGPTRSELPVRSCLKSSRVDHVGITDFRNLSVQLRNIFQCHIQCQPLEPNKF